MAVEAQTVETPVVEVPKATEVLESMTSDERHDWQLTGKVPARPKTGESSTPAAPADKEKSEPEKQAETASAPDTDKPAQEPDKGKQIEHLSRSDRRVSELLAERRALRDKLEELKREKATPKAVEQADSAPAHASLPTIPATLKAKIDALIENADKFERYEDLIAAIVLETQQSVGPDTVKAILKQEAEAQQKAKAQEKIADSWMQSVKAAAGKHADYQSVVDTPEMAELIPVNSPLNALLIDSEMGGEVLYYLGQHQDEIVRLQGLAPIAQAREVFKIEQALSEKSPAPPVNRAPEPPTVLGTGETASADAVSEALKNKDFKAYEKAANEKDKKRFGP
ncbi:MAG: hypothetical protein WC378_17855 [Opitutaceae bacterium]|jgi:hypothetical protein